MKQAWRAVLVIGLLWTYGLAHAQDAAPQNAEAAATTAKDEIPEPRSGDFDWVRMKNGEWIKGEIKELQDDSFIFDSDTFDEVTLDWEDVAEVYSNRTNLMMFQGKRTVEGTLEVDTDAVRVATTDGEQTLPREELRMIVPGPATEINYWSAKLSLGATVQSGNVDQTDISGFVRVQRRDALSRLEMEYTGVYGEVGGVKTADNHRATLSYDIYLTERFYVRPVFLIFYRDPFVNIDYRVTPGAGFGYDIIDDGRFEWSTGGGIGYQYTRFTSPPPGAPTDDGTIAALFGTRFKWEATKKIDMGVDFDITVPLPESSLYNFRTVLWTEVEIYGDLDLDVRFTWDHQNDPAPNTDGSLPLPDDYRLYVGLGWSF